MMEDDGTPTLRYSCRTKTWANPPFRAWSAMAPRYCGFEKVSGDSATGNSAAALGGMLFCASFAGGISVPAGFKRTKLGSRRSLRSGNAGQSKQENQRDQTSARVE